MPGHTCAHSEATSARDPARGLRGTRWAHGKPALDPRRPLREHRRCARRPPKPSDHDREGPFIPPTLIVAHEVNGELVTLNNRTLYVAQQANLPVVAIQIDNSGSAAHRVLAMMRESGLSGPSQGVRVRCP